MLYDVDLLVQSLSGLLVALIFEFALSPPEGAFLDAAATARLQEPGAIVVGEGVAELVGVDDRAL